jgi:hypothetical protein
VVPHGVRQAWGENFYAEIFCDLYFVADNIIALNTGYVKRGVLVTDRKLIARRYFRWATFLSGDRWSFYVFLMVGDDVSGTRM